MLEKLGRNDSCPCGSGRRFQALLLGQRALLMVPSARTFGASAFFGVRRPRTPQLADVAETVDAAGRELAEVRLLGVQVSPSALMAVTCGWFRGPSVKRALEVSTGGSIPPSPTGDASVAQVARATVLTPEVPGSTPGGGTTCSTYNCSPVGAVLQHAAFSQRRPSVGIRHGRLDGRYLPAWRNQADAPCPEREALRRKCRFESCRRHSVVVAQHRQERSPGT